MLLDVSGKTTKEKFCEFLDYADNKFKVCYNLFVIYVKDLHFFRYKEGSINGY